MRWSTSQRHVRSRTHVGRQFSAALMLALCAAPAAGQSAATPAGRSVASRAPIAATAVHSHARDTIAAAARTYANDYRRPATIPHPDDNAPNAHREELGRMLFFEPRISASGVTSCASCHNPAFAWGDGLPRAVGAGMAQLGRRSPTVLNTAWAEALFWDGRASTLEEQALGPIQAEGEMNMPLEVMIARLDSIEGYRPLFEKAYPGEGLTTETVAKAIATFERSVVSGTAPFDAWVAGDEDAISDEAKLGFVLFNGKARCATCHSGWRFTDDSFHDIGVPGTDLGRGGIVPIDAVMHAFKTPTLRNVDQRGPYMHDGSEATLMDVIELYDRGGRVQRPSLSPELEPLGLTDVEKKALVAYMLTLTSVDRPVAIPTLPR